MRFMKVLVITVILLGGIGYGVYHYGTAYASEKVLDVVSMKLEENEQLDEVKTYLRNDATVQSFLAAGVHVDESQLPFTTKEQAVRALLPKVGVTDLKNIKSAAKNGFSIDEQKALLQSLEGKLSEEELLALKYIAYKELMN